MVKGGRVTFVYNKSDLVHSKAFSGRQQTTILVQTQCTTCEAVLHFCQKYMFFEGSIFVYVMVKGGRVTFVKGAGHHW